MVLYMSIFWFDDPDVEIFLLGLVGEPLGIPQLAVRCPGDVKVSTNNKSNSLVSS